MGQIRTWGEREASRDYKLTVLDQSVVINLDDSTFTVDKLELSLELRELQAPGYALRRVL